MLGTQHLLGADVPPLGAILVTQSGRTATGDCQYVSRVPGGDIPPLGAALVAQRLRADVPPLVTAGTYPGCCERTYRQG
jgi:hypothetical protein